ncbi:hypothetical protein SLEP1_g28605 [Rubroshorea leprosula]|uniref:Uncharacterized protein n=1 Tax=Rubroshorea leprosula TaxID=152421 RepID=A0AAV5K3M7_9ROSI|nr:hypothetical protein SLEP1_g28605 [Rubroshorea leprosula]
MSGHMVINFGIFWLGSWLFCHPSTWSEFSVLCN